MLLWNGDLFSCPISTEEFVSEKWEYCHNLFLLWAFILLYFLFSLIIDSTSLSVITCDWPTLGHLLTSNTTDNMVNTTVSFKCQQGFKLQCGTTSAVLVCNEKGEWSMPDWYHRTSIVWRNMFNVMYISDGCSGKFIDSLVKLVLLKMIPLWWNNFCNVEPLT